ncbi:MAG TPA: S8 family serine peptidase, partial [Trueperaceae bacterium]|nr:S8 family serine peptidase [Trueperaceae bacterium]
MMSTVKYRSGAIGSSRLVPLVLAVSLLLAACGEPNPPPGEQKGRVSGSVVVGATGTGAAVPLVRAAERGAAAASDASGDPAAVDSWSLEDSSLEFVPGEVVVRYADAGLGAAAVPAARPVLEAAGATFGLERSLAAAGMRLYLSPGLDKAGTLAAVKALNARPDVLYAFPNYIYQPAAVPDDPQYGRQWHYDAINMEAAWDLTTGDSNVVVAVLDSGVIDSHPDFGARLLDGYDFIMDAESANDGDARDPDPYDDVDNGEGFHGTHVAGTIGAATDNGVGVAGVDWQAKILPVRVLGSGGGTFADIADALIWAVGGSVLSVPDNGNPADVINLSLGGASETCTQAWQDVFDIVNQFAVVVVCL